VGKIGDSRGKVYEALRSNVNGDIVVVPSFVKTTCKTSGEYSATERIQRCDFEAFVSPETSRVSLNYYSDGIKTYQHWTKWKIIVTIKAAMKKSAAPTLGA
jgi:hypothetical protein